MYKYKLYILLLYNSYISENKVLRSQYLYNINNISVNVAYITAERIL